MAQNKTESPWYLGVEHMTRDSQGNILFKGRRADHDSNESVSLDDRAIVARMQQECLFLEQKGIDPAEHMECDWVVRGKYAEEFGRDRQAALDALLGGDRIYFTEVMVYGNSFLLPGWVQEAEIFSKEWFGGAAGIQRPDNMLDNFNFYHCEYGDFGPKRAATAEEVFILEACYDYLEGTRQVSIETPHPSAYEPRETPAEGLSNQQKCLAILEQDPDGESLAPGHVGFVVYAMQNSLDAAQQKTLDELYRQVINETYVLPWHLGVEHMTMDSDGTMFFKGRVVEYYNRNLAFTLGARADLVRLQQTCLFLEARGEALGTFSSFLCSWSPKGRLAEEFARDRLAALDRLCSGECISFSRIKTGWRRDHFLLPGQPGRDEIYESAPFLDLVKMGWVAAQGEALDCQACVYGTEGPVRPATAQELDILECCFDYLQETRQLQTAATQYPALGAALDEDVEDYER